jgi:hypothetical protein
MTSRAERKRAKREEIERVEREQRLERKRAALAEGLALVHEDAGSFDRDDRPGAVLIDGPTGRVLTRRIDTPMGLSSMSRPVGSQTSLPDGHPRFGEDTSISTRALMRDALDPRVSGQLPETIRDEARWRLLDGM